ncbi:hypothetical protein KRP22_000326 [Phytophthora ramorum]|nr:hypothetical protein KRP22_12272 [Phytophthora ramorum]
MVLWSKMLEQHVSNARKARQQQEDEQESKFQNSYGTGLLGVSKGKAQPFTVCVKLVKEIETNLLKEAFTDPAKDVNPLVYALDMAVLRENDAKQSGEKEELVSAYTDDISAFTSCSGDISNGIAQNCAVLTLLGTISRTSISVT